MTLDRDIALRGAIAWLASIRDLARKDVSFANLLIDTQPDGVSLRSLASVLDDPTLLTEDEKNLIRNHQKIPHAVKRIRDRTHLGLMECKKIADNWEKSEQAYGRLAPVYKPTTDSPPPLPTTPPPLPCSQRPIIDLDFNLDDLKRTEPKARPAFGHDSPTPFDPTAPHVNADTTPTDLATMSPGSDDLPRERSPRAFD